MSLLTLIQGVCNEIGLPEPSTVVNNDDLTIKQLLRITHRAAKDMRNSHLWAELSKEHTITLSDSVDNYELPGDFDRQIFNTHWDQSNQWKLHGPLTADEWQEWQNGIVSAGPRRRFRVKGAGSARFYIDPTPSSDDAGNVLVFEYISSQWIYPRTWTNGATFTANQYCSYNGNVYKTTLGGTTGATAPTHTTGSSSDGAVTWTYQEPRYSDWLADTDFSVLDEDVLSLGVQWRYLRQKGLPYQTILQDYKAEVRRTASHQKGATTIPIGKNRLRRFMSSTNIPDTGYGS